MSLRAQHRTVQRRHLRLRPTALAAADGTCPCGATVVVNEPIVLVGSAIDQAPDGTKRVDLTGAEWRCQRCDPGVQP